MATNRPILIDNEHHASLMDMCLGTSLSKFTVQDLANLILWHFLREPEPSRSERMVRVIAMHLSEKMERNPKPSMDAHDTDQASSMVQ